MSKRNKTGSKNGCDEIKEKKIQRNMLLAVNDLTAHAHP
jgi:hypothetical protein